MKRWREIAVYFIFFVLFFVTTTSTIYGFSRQPDLTVIAPYAPDDLSLFLRMKDGTEREHGGFDKEGRTWRFFSDNYCDALIVKSAAKEFACELSLIDMGSGLKLITLDYANERIIYGHTRTRLTLLLSIHIGVILLIKGLVLIIFRYKKRLSWLIFFFVNLIQQGLLYYYLLQWKPSGFGMLFFIPFVAILILILELVVYAISLKEHRVRRAILYTVVANLMSFFLGIAIFGNLPMWPLY